MDGSRLDTIARKIPYIAASLVGVLAVIVLGSWATGAQLALSIVPETLPMLPVAAACFLLLALSLGLSEAASRSDLTRWLQQLLALAVAVIAVTEFVEYALERN